MPNTALIGIAGVHHVVSELSRRGYIALPTVKNTAAYDIVALNVEGDRHANIQVKASSKRVNFFPMPSVDKVRTGRSDFYVLVRWVEKDQQYEEFLLSGRQAKQAVEDALDHQSAAHERGTLKRLFPCIYVNQRNAGEVEHWRKAWKVWTLR